LILKALLNNLQKEIYVYLHYSRFWNINVRDKLIVVFHKYFKRFHVAEKHKIMAAATNIHTITANNLHSTSGIYMEQTFLDFLRTLFLHWNNIQEQHLSVQPLTRLQVSILWTSIDGRII
jgi:hypothetical protein